MEGLVDSHSGLEQMRGIWEVHHELAQDTVDIKRSHSTQSRPLFLGYRGSSAFQDLTNVSFSDYMLEKESEIN